MLVSWGEIGESMSYFSPGSSNKSIRARTRSPAVNSSSSRSFCVCLSPGAPRQTSHKWLSLVYHNCTAPQGAADRELRLHFVQSPGAVVSTLPDEIPSGRNEKQQTGVGLLGWKFAVIYKGSGNQGVSCSPVCRVNKQWKVIWKVMCNTCSQQQEQRAKCGSCFLYMERATGKSMSFPWLTTIISSKVFAASEITAS